MVPLMLWTRFAARVSVIDRPKGSQCKTCCSNVHADYDVVIVGAGVAGSALGFALGKQGRKVLIIERDLKEPDRIVGELLQPGGVQRLHDLGLESCTEGIDSVKVVGYAVYLSGKSVRCPYPNYSDIGSVVKNGNSFHHGRFIMKLREAAMSQQNVTVLQGTVLKLIEENGRIQGITCKNDVGEVQEYKAGLTICCDGAGSGLRRNLTPAKPFANSHFVALLLENCPLPYPNSGHVILADPAPVLCYPISSTEVRCLIDVPGRNLPSISTGAMAEYLLEKMAPQMPPEVQPSFCEAIKAGRIRSMPNWELPPQQVHQPGALLLGDSFNCRHPLTGGGMTVALSDVHLLATLLEGVMDFTDDKALEQVNNRFNQERKPLASTINILASALYAVFCATKDPVLQEMRKACFAYFQLGGRAVSGPMWLLSGMNPNPYHLISHFSLVALFGVARMIVPFPGPLQVMRSYRLVQAAASIAYPLLLREKVFSWLPSFGYSSDLACH